MSVSLPSVAEVRAIITTSLEDDQVQYYIDDAALLVEDCVSSLDEARQKAIVKWTAAHLIASSPAGATRVVTSQKLGDASETYATGQVTGAGLGGSAYGIQAMSLDPNGCLAGLGLRPIIFDVL